MLDPAIDELAGPHTSADRSLTLQRIAIALCFVALVVLAYTRNVNWDEFHYLNFVYAWLDGSLDRPMQMGHVYVFGWLAMVPGGEIAQIFAARLVMVLFVGVTAFSIHAIARHFTDNRFAVFAVLAYLCSGFALAHAGSFRADPIAAALLTSALAIAVTTRLAASHILAIGLLVALSFMVTIKSALFMPCFLGVILWRISERGAALKLFGAAFLAFGLFAALYVWHASGLSVAEGKDTASTATNAVENTLLAGGLFPRSDTILSWALFSFPQVVLCLLAFKVLGMSRQALVLALFLVPCLSVVIYRNAFVYFFPFATPMLMVVAAIGAQRAVSIVTAERSLVVMCAAAVLQLFWIAPENSHTQRATIAEVHRLFQEPVPYIDGYSMVASFPNTSFFNSSWGVSRYRSEGVPVFADIIRDQKPPLLIAHRRPLGAAMLEDPPRNTERDLLPEDRAALRAAYIHYSGSLWLAGVQSALTDTPQNLTLPFSGQYRLEAENLVEINGQVYEPGARVAFAEQDLLVSGASGTELRLIWDTGVDPIAPTALGRDVFAGFTSLVLFD